MKLYYVYVPDKAEEISVVIARLLRSMGASGTYAGFNYAVYMIERIVRDEADTDGITKLLYPETAKHFKTTPVAVDQAVLRLIRRCWEKGDREMMNTVAGYTLGQKPGNAKFIDMVAAYIKSMV